MNTFHLAVLDVGGTKAQAAVFDASGNILAASREPGGTPLEHGIEACMDRFGGQLERLIARVGTPIEALYVSLATVEYFGSAMQDYLQTRFPIPHMRVEGDGPCLISAMLGHRDGVCMICGTGSSLYVRKGDDYYHTGGWGHLIDSCGSGFVLGRRAIKAVLRAYDKRGEATMLTEIINKKCGKPIWEDYVHMYQLGRPYIASYAGCVFEARNLGDPVARKIYNVCASDLSDLVWTTRGELGKPFDIVLGGGIFANYPEYAETIRALSPGDVRFMRLDVPPVYGCAVEAMHDIGLETDETFKENFLKGLAKA